MSAAGAWGVVLPGHSEARPCLLPGEELTVWSLLSGGFFNGLILLNLGCVGREIGAGQEGMSFCRWKYRRRILLHCCVLISFFEPAERW